MVDEIDCEKLLEIPSINGLMDGSFVKRDTSEIGYVDKVGQVVELDLEKGRCRVAWPSMAKSDYGKITRTWYKASKLIEVKLRSEIPECLRP